MSGTEQIEALRAQASRNAGRDWSRECASAERARSMVWDAAGLRLDLSREHLDAAALDSLFALARSRSWQQKREAQWAGETVNITEGRAVLHGALRSPERAPKAIAERVRENEAALCSLVERLQQGAPDAAVLHIGIGGSDLGPRLAAAVAATCGSRRALHFLNNLDDATLDATLAQLDPRKVIVVTVSKSGTTAETCRLQGLTYAWLEAAGVDPVACSVAVTGNKDFARECGLQPSQILELPEWVGGRYSLWSAVSVSIALAFGLEARQELLRGAAAMDVHFLEAPLERNLPALAGLCGVWHANGYGFNTRVVVPYADMLSLLPEYLQQLEMESNGKRVDLDGQPLTYATAPATFGGVGSCVQHAFFQLLHQSDAVHPVEFVLPARVTGVDPRMQRSLISNALAQACALTQGRSADGDQDLSRECPGSRPSTLILMRSLDMWHLGALLAFYEHRTAFQGWVWNINSFDQFGVEIGKKIAKDVESAIEGESEFPDASTKSAAEWLFAGS